jgi:hypothetical protein
MFALIFAFPPLGLTRSLLHSLHFNHVVAFPNVIWVFLHLGHWILINLDGFKSFGMKMIDDGGFKDCCEIIGLSLNQYLGHSLDCLQIHLLFLYR